MAVAGAALLVILALVARNLQVERVRAHVSLSLFAYVAGPLILIRGVESVGFTTVAVGWLTALPHGPLGESGRRAGGRGARG